MVVKPIAKITRDVIREFMIPCVLPAIRTRWPLEDANKPIYILQDIVPSHIRVEHRTMSSSLKLVKKMVSILASFFNHQIHRIFDIVDLGISRAIQAIEIKKVAKTVDGINY